MGSITFTHKIKASSPKEAFDLLCADATYEHGNDPYNGTINTCYLGRKTLSFDRPTDKREKDAWTHVNKELNEVEKCLANYVDLGVVEYKVSTFKKKNSTNSAPKYKLGFVVVNESEMPLRATIFSTKTEAMGRALELSVKTGKLHSVEKRYELVEGSSNVGFIEKETKSYKTLPKLKPAPNRVVNEIHEYIFYGRASY